MGNSSSVFPYGIHFSEDGLIRVDPVAHVRISPKKGGVWWPFFLLIDSGATISALPKSDAEALGVTLTEGKKLVISGVGGEPVVGWQHALFVKFMESSTVFSVPFVFLDNPKAPRILGREGVFEKFTFVFEEDNRRSGVLQTGSRESKSVSVTLDKIAGRIRR